MPAFLTLLLLAVSWVCSAGTEELTQKFRALADYRTIRADFIQTRYLKELDMRVEIKGEMDCEKNGRLRWEVKSPVRSITIMGKTELRHLDIETGKRTAIQAQKFPWLQILRDCLTDWISCDPDRLARRFELSVKDDHTLRLLPKETQLKQIFQSVEIRADLPFRTIEAIIIEEISGDRLEIRFLKVQKNPVLPEKLWRMPSP